MSATQPLDPGGMILGLCAQLFAEPQRVVSVHREVLGGRALRILPHQHRDLLQMDVAVGCTGRWEVDGAAVLIHQTTAAVFYPAQVHRYELRPAGADASVYVLKLRVRRTWPCIRRRVFQPVVTAVSGHVPLIGALRRMTQFEDVTERRPPMLMATVAEVLCLWPGGQSAVKDAPVEPDDADTARRLRRVRTAIERDLTDLPTLEQLAQLAHLSPRHLRRLFRQAHGCAPQAYIAARRLARATELLAQQRLTITQVAEDLGFADIHSFSRWFTRQTGTAPSRFRQRPTLL